MTALSIKRSRTNYVVNSGGKFFRSYEFDLAISANSGRDTAEHATRLN